MKLVLASNNQGKLAELQAMFARWAWNWCARATWAWRGRRALPHLCRERADQGPLCPQHTGLPALADDAGMCVDAFGGLPGVDTAYYCTQFGYEKATPTTCVRLLEQMQGVTNRRAAMVSTLVAVRSPQDPEPLIAVGRVVGEITTEPRGSNGFGFDPVMFIPGIWQDLCRAARGGEERAQPPGAVPQQMLA